MQKYVLTVYRGKKCAMTRQGQQHYNHNYNKAALTDPSNKGGNMYNILYPELIKDLIPQTAR